MSGQRRDEQLPLVAREDAPTTAIEDAVVSPQPRALNLARQTFHETHLSPHQVGPWSAEPRAQSRGMWRALGSHTSVISSSKPHPACCNAGPTAIRPGFGGSTSSHL